MGNVSLPIGFGVIGSATSGWFLHSLATSDNPWGPVGWAPMGIVLGGYLVYSYAASRGWLGERIEDEVRAQVKAEKRLVRQEGDGKSFTYQQQAGPRPLTEQEMKTVLLDPWHRFQPAVYLKSMPYLTAKSFAAKGWQVAFNQRKMTGEILNDSFSTRVTQGLWTELTDAFASAHLIEKKPKVAIRVMCEGQGGTASLSKLLACVSAWDGEE